MSYRGARAPKNGNLITPPTTAGSSVGPLLNETKWDLVSFSFLKTAIYKLN